MSLLRSGRPVRLPVSGWSMKPLLPPGSVVRIVPFREPPRVGDVVLYRRSDGKLISHRVLTRSADFFRSKGDACAQPEELRHRSCILGKVVALERPWPLHLDGYLARLSGRLLGRLYPILVKLKMAAARRLTAEGAPDV